MYQPNQTEQQSGKYFFAMFCIYVFLSFLGQSILIGLVQSGTTLYNCLVSLIAPISLMVVIIYAKAKQNKSFKQLTQLNGFSKKHLPLSFLLFVGMLLGLGFVNGVFAHFLKNLGLNLPQSQVAVNSVGELIVYGVTLCLIPAVVEELFFRGLILGQVKNGKPIYSILYVGVLFALYHASPTQLIYQFIYGGLLTLLAIVCKSVIPCIITHFLNNFAIILLSFLRINLNLYSWYVIVVGLACLTVFVAVTIKMLKKQSFTPQQSSVYFNLYSILGGVLCLMMIGLTLTA